MEWKVGTLWPYDLRLAIIWVDKYKQKVASGNNMFLFFRCLDLSFKLPSFFVRNAFKKKQYHYGVPRNRATYHHRRVMIEALFSCDSVKAFNSQCCCTAGLIMCLQSNPFMLTTGKSCIRVVSMSDTCASSVEDIINQYEKQYAIGSWTSVFMLDSRINCIEVTQRTVILPSWAWVGVWTTWYSTKDQ